MFAKCYCPSINSLGFSRKSAADPFFPHSTSTRLNRNLTLTHIFIFSFKLSLWLPVSVVFEFEPEPERHNHNDFRIESTMTVIITIWTKQQSKCCCHLSCHWPKHSKERPMPIAHDINLWRTTTTFQIFVSPPHLLRQPYIFYIICDAICFIAISVFVLRGYSSYS